MKKRKSKQDFQQGEPFFARKTTFHEAYPHVVSLDLVIEAKPIGLGHSHTYHYSLDNPPSNFSPCPNQNCTAGGFNIGLFLDGLIAKRQTKGKDIAKCAGRERMGKGTTRTCCYMFEAIAEIKYAE